MTFDAPNLRHTKTEDEVTTPTCITTCVDVASRLCAVVLCLMLLLTSSPAMAADRAGDEFLTGYVASILERDLHWERDSYILKVVNGVATITLFKDDPMRREAADKAAARYRRTAGDSDCGEACRRQINREQ